MLRLLLVCDFNEFFVDFFFYNVQIISVIFLSQKVYYCVILTPATPPLW